MTKDALEKAKEKIKPQGAKGEINIRHDTFMAWGFFCEWFGKTLKDIDFDKKFQVIVDYDPELPKCNIYISQDVTNG